MTAKPRMGHRSDEITSYLSETLEPEQRAKLEAHLATCDECRDELAAQRALFDQVNEALAFKPKRTIDEQVARFEREVAVERATRRRRWAWRIPLAAAVAALAALLAVVAFRQQPQRPDQLQAAPRRPAGP